MRTVISRALKHISNIPGWRTRRKIVVIESDDWGSIRMPSAKVFETLKAKAIDLEGRGSAPYNRNDTLASSKDLASLFETLSAFKDQHGRHPPLTAVCNVANPDFERIRFNQFRTYYYEPFTKTLERYGHGDSFNLWREGIRDKLFVPQFHGREHLNVAVWMKALQNSDPHARLAFDHGMWGFNNQHLHRIMYQAAFDLSEQSELASHHKIIEDGLALFHQLFGYKASFFVPPNGPFNNHLEGVAAANGIQYMSTSKIRREPKGGGRSRYVFHCLGQKNRHGQIYMTRNCVFEPSQVASEQAVRTCLEHIRIAFDCMKPAIISTHRVNYIGALDENNRKKGLGQLRLLLEQVLLRWPDVEFMTSNELGGIIKNEATQQSCD